MGFIKSIRDFLGNTVQNSTITGIDAKAMETIYIKELALYIATSYIANTLSKCEIKVYEKNKEVHNQLYYELNVSPNPNQNSSQFMNKFITNYLYKGDALVFAHKNHLYCADDFMIDPKPFGENIFQDIQVDGTQLSNKKFKASDVFYFKLDNGNTVKSLIDGLYKDYSKVIAQAISAFKQTNGQKYKYMMDNFAMGDTEFQENDEKRIQAQLKKFIESDVGILPMYRGSDLVDMSTTSRVNSADLLSLRKEIFDIVSQAYKIPLSMMYGNITNMDEIVKVYLTVCIDPIADMISEELSRKTNTFAEWQKGNYIKVDTSCITHMDIMQVADKVDKLISCGITTIDELRDRLNMTILNTDFSKQHYLTKNYSKIEDVVSNDISTEVTPIQKTIEPEIIQEE